MSDDYIDLETLYKDYMDAKSEGEKEHIFGALLSYLLRQPWCSLIKKNSSGSDK